MSEEITTDTLIAGENVQSVTTGFGCACECEQRLHNHLF